MRQPKLSKFNPFTWLLIGMICCALGCWGFIKEFAQGWNLCLEALKDDDHLSADEIQSTIHDTVTT